MSIGGFFKNTLAMLIRCFCPPDNFTPRSPTYALYPLANELINSSTPANLAALMISSSDAPGLPYSIFSLIVPEKR